jgi:outer membrane protein TolC
MNVKIVLPLLVATSVAASAGAQSLQPQGSGSSPFLGSVPQGTVSAAPLPLSLKDAVTRALQHNLGLLLQEEAVNAAHGAHWRALADLLPNTYAMVGGSRQVINLEAYGFPAPDPIVGPFNVFDARVYLSQPILDLHALNTARAASASERAEQHGIRTARDLVTLVAVNLYLQTVAAASRVEAARAQHETAEVLQQQAADLKGSGLVAGIDVLRAQVQVQNQRQRLIVAENEFERSKLELARAIGIPVAQPLTLTDAIPYAPMPDVNLETAMTRALETRADYLAAQERVRAAEASVAAAHGSLLPSLRADADYGTIGQTVSDAHPTFRIAANVRIPIFEAGRATERSIQAGAELARRQAELGDFKQRVEFEVRSAVLDLRAAGQRLEAAQTNVTLAGQELTQARDRFAAGVASNIEITQAQDSVAAASENYIAALYAHNLAKAMLARAVGTAEESVMTFLGGAK